MLALILAIVLLAIALYMARSARRFHVAPILWCAAWGTMLLLYRLFGRVYDYDRGTVALTAGCIAAWLVGHAITARLVAPPPPERAVRPRPFQIRRLPILLGACTLIGLIAPVNWMATTGVGLERITETGDLAGAARASYELLLQQRVEQDWITKVTLAIALAGVITASIYIGLGRPIDLSAPPRLTWSQSSSNAPPPPRPTPYWLLLAPFLPFLAMMALSTIRTLLIVPLLMAFCAWVAGLHMRRRERHIFRSGIVLPLLAIAGGAIVILFYAQAVRDGDPLLTHAGDTFAALRLWVAGYEPALVSWLKRGWDGEYHWGTSTFRIITGIFGSDYKLVYGTGAIEIGNNETSNAMTALRYFIEDWGRGGAVVFSALFGLLCGYLTTLMVRGRLLLTPFYALLLATAIFAPNSWFLNYGSRVLAPAMATLFLLFYSSRTDAEQKQQKHRPVRVKRRQRH